MGLKNFLPKLSGSVEDDPEEPPDAAPAAEDCDRGPDVVAINDVVPRERTTVCGEIAEVRVVHKAGSPWLEATVSDGTGKLVATWTGRRGIAGVEPGHRLVLTGRASPTGPGGRLLLLNPLYELL